MPQPEQLLQIIKIQTEVAKIGLDLGAVMQYVVEQTLTLVGAEGSVIELAEDGEMVYRAAAGIAATQLGLRLKIATSMSGLCVRSGETLLCEDSQHDPRVDRAACERVGLRSMIVMPLKHQNVTVGVLKAMSMTPNKFTAADIQLMTMVSELIAASIYFSVKYDLQNLFYRATHDALTDLPNRSLFMDHLKNLDRFTGTKHQALGVLMIDVDGLKQVNDNLGHEAGDALLLEFAKRLKRVVRSTDTVARLGGDEFGLLLVPFDSHELIDSTIARIDQAIAEPMMIDTNRVTLSASIGAATLPDDSSDPNQILMIADQRMYVNKRRRKADRQSYH